MNETTTHTPTPWIWGKDGNTSQGGPSIQYDDGHGSPWYLFEACGGLPDDISDQQEANAAHIVRCVNAHDGLVAALRTISALSNAPKRHCDDYGDIARAALRDAGITESEVTP